MILLWFVFLIETLMLYLLRQFTDYIGLHVCLIAFNSFLVVVLALKSKKSLSVPLLIGYFLRLFAVALDTQTDLLSDMNGDIQEYYTAAWQYSQDPGLSNLYGGVYPKILGILFRFTGASPLLGAYTNVLIGISTICVIYRVMEKGNVPYKVQKTVAYWMALFPYSVYNSSVVYRETSIAFLFVVSFYFAFCWYQHPKTKYLILCLMTMAITSVFHAGSIVFAGGYLLLFLFYVPSRNRFVVRKDILATVFVIGIAAGVILLNPRLFLAKFQGVMQNSDALISQFNLNFGGSAYLVNLQASSVQQVILMSPLKALYFLFSPVPFDWRNIMDAAMFILDSMSYLYCLVYVIRHRRESPFNPLLTTVFIGILATAWVFGIGTWTAGTAIRHRNKFFGVLLMLFSLASVKANERAITLPPPSKYAR